MEDTINIDVDELSVSGNDSVYSDLSVSGNDSEYTDLSVIGNDSNNNNSQLVPVISRDDIKIAFSESLSDYFSNECISVVQTDEGLEKQISDFSMSDICLVLILMILIAQSILKIIGGKAWNK